MLSSPAMSAVTRINAESQWLIGGKGIGTKIITVPYTAAWEGKSLPDESSELFLPHIALSLLLVTYFFFQCCWSSQDRQGMKGGACAFYCLSSKKQIKNSTCHLIQLPLHPSFAVSCGFNLGFYGFI